MRELKFEVQREAGVGCENCTTTLSWMGNCGIWDSESFPLTILHHSCRQKILQVKKKIVRMWFQTMHWFLGWCAWFSCNQGTRWMFFFLIVINAQYVIVMNICFSLTWTVQIVKKLLLQYSRDLIKCLIYRNWCGSRAIIMVVIYLL